MVRAAGVHGALIGRFPGVSVDDLRGQLIAPGFVDMHIHYPQTDVIGAPAAGLLPWLEQYTFPHESRFHEPAHAREVARFFFDELARNGVTTALTFSTSHPASADAASGRTQRFRLTSNTAGRPRMQTPEWMQTSGSKVTVMSGVS